MKINKNLKDTLAWFAFCFILIECILLFGMSEMKITNFHPIDFAISFYVAVTFTIPQLFKMLPGGKFLKSIQVILMLITWLTFGINIIKSLL